MTTREPPEDESRLRAVRRSWRCMARDPPESLRRCSPVRWRNPCSTHAEARSVSGAPCHTGQRRSSPNVEVISRCARHVNTGFVMSCARGKRAWMAGVTGPPCAPGADTGGRRADTGVVVARRRERLRCTDVDVASPRERRRCTDVAVASPRKRRRYTDVGVTSPREHRRYTDERPRYTAERRAETAIAVI
jgi:hypothetical protein